jgi:hypothetical protein
MKNLTRAMMVGLMVVGSGAVIGSLTGCSGSSASAEKMGKMSGDKMSGDKMSGDKMGGDKMSGDKMSGDKMNDKK